MRCYQDDKNRANLEQAGWLLIRQGKLVVIFVIGVGFQCKVAYMKKCT